MSVSLGELAVRFGCELRGDPEARIERILEELAHGEILDTGLILSPDVKFYPVSIDRFLHEILDREFSE